MSLNEKDAYELAIGIIESEDCDDSSLEAEHINRGHNFQKISSNIFQLSIDRQAIIFWFIENRYNFTSYWRR